MGIRRGAIQLIMALCMLAWLVACGSDDPVDVMHQGSGDLDIGSDQVQTEDGPPATEDTQDITTPNSDDPSVVTREPIVTLIGETEYGNIVEIEEQLYLESSGTTDRKLISNPDLLTQNPQFNSDRSRLLYRSYNPNEWAYPIIDIYSLVTGDTLEINVTDDLGAQIMDFYWVNDEVILVEGHLNPSADGYVIYDSTNGELINHSGGLLYQVLADNKTMLFQLQPHWVDQRWANLMIATLEDMFIDIYRGELEENEEIIDAKVSPDLATIAMWTHRLDRNKAYLQVATIDASAWKIGPWKNHSVDVELDGTIHFDEETRTIHLTDEVKFKY